MVYCSAEKATALKFVWEPDMHCMLGLDSPSRPTVVTPLVRAAKLDSTCMGDHER